MMENNCRNIQEQIPKFLTGTLKAEQSAELQKHISNCSSCREYLGDLQEDDELLGKYAEAMRPAVARIEDKVIESLNRRSLSRPARAVSLWRRL